MGRILDGARAFFTADDWKFTEDHERDFLRLSFQGKDGSWRCVAHARETQEQLIFFSVVDIKIPSERRAEVAEFITRANYGIHIGNFEMDYSDGEVRYKTSIDFEGTEVTHALCKQMVYPNVFTMDRYLKGILAVAFGGKNPKQAVDESEGR